MALSAICLLLLVMNFMAIHVSGLLVTSKWMKAHATFYGGSDAAGTMGGACGYGNLYTQGYGTSTAALSTQLFNNGASCGQCYELYCRDDLTPQWCIKGARITVTATNYCPPNYALPSNAGGWCNPPRKHFDLAQPIWEKIGIYRAGIIPVMYRRVPCYKTGGIRFTINGFDYWELVLLTNIAGPGSVKAMSVKSKTTKWLPMTRNWGANWQSGENWHWIFKGQPITFRLYSTDNQKLIFPDIVNSNWQFSQSFTSSAQFTIGNQV